MKTLICKLRRRHDWRVWPSDDDRCETCGLFRLYPSGDIVRVTESGYKVILYGKPATGRSLAAPVTRTKPFDIAPIETEDAPLAPPGPRARPSSLAERARMREV